MRRGQSVRVPSYRLHRPSGQAVVTLSGRDFYLGPHGTKASKNAYDRIVGEWQARGRRLEMPAESGGLTMSELILAYWRFAERHYVKGGKPTSQLDLIRRTFKVVRQLYGKEPAASFGPLALKAVRQRFVDNGLSRSTCNDNVARIKRMFRWAVAEQMIDVAVYTALAAVPGLPKGRCEAPDHPPVGPVPAEHLAAVLPRVRPPVRAMLELQDATGMRPGEVVIMRGMDIDRSGDVWRYVPRSHKTEHHDRARVILLGPKAQEILRPWLTAKPDAYLFRPRAQRGRSAGLRYTTATYGARVRDACDRAGIVVFSPNQVRHAAATRIRAAFGLEAAQVVLGHSKADVTQVYAERDEAKAAEVARKLG